MSVRQPDLKTDTGSCERVWPQTRSRQNRPMPELYSHVPSTCPALLACSRVLYLQNKNTRRRNTAWWAVKAGLLPTRDGFQQSCKNLLDARLVYGTQPRLSTRLGQCSLHCFEFWPSMLATFSEALVYAVRPRLFWLHSIYMYWVTAPSLRITWTMWRIAVWQKSKMQMQLKRKAGTSIIGLAQRICGRDVHVKMNTRTHVDWLVQQNLAEI